MRRERPSRRDVLRSAVALVSAGLVGDGIRNVAGAAGRFNIGACDWSIGMRGKTGAMALARELGLDGVQVSMGSVESDLHLRQSDVQRAYREAAAASGVRVGGIALDVLNQVPYKSDPRTEQWVSDSIDCRPRARRSASSCSRSSSEATCGTTPRARRRSSDG